MVQFGLTLNQYVMLWNGVGVGAMQFAISRGGEQHSLQQLRQPDPKYGADAEAGEPDDHIHGQWDGVRHRRSVSDGAVEHSNTPPVASATYRCDLTVMGQYFYPGCSLTAQEAELVR